MGWYTSYLILCRFDEDAECFSNHLNKLFDAGILTSSGGGFETIKEPQIRPNGEWRVNGGIVLGAIKWGNEEKIKSEIESYIAKNKDHNIQVFIKSEHDDWWSDILE